MKIASKAPSIYHIAQLVDDLLVDGQCVLVPGYWSYWDQVFGNKDLLYKLITRSVC